MKIAKFLQEGLEIEGLPSEVEELCQAYASSIRINFNRFRNTSQTSMRKACFSKLFHSLCLVFDVGTVGAHNKLTHFYPLYCRVHGQAQR